ncbi:MAG: hypothetical protein LKK13_03365 [Bacilli bacterium]|jgi:AcrR family transcriptional regulator|nr:hypothetical protein [Bacilli bacterium]
MARKRILSEKQVIVAAFALVREGGAEELNSRSLAKRLGTSTQPIFTLFKTMDPIVEGVKEEAYALYESRLREALHEPEGVAKAAGVAYIGFALKEPNLFRLLFMGKPDQTRSFASVQGTESIVASLMKECRLDEKRAKELYFEIGVFAHGLAVSLVTKTLAIRPEDIGRIMNGAIDGFRMHFERKED